MKSSILEKALKTRNGSVQDALADIPRLAESQNPTESNSPSSNDHETSSYQIPSQLPQSTANTPKTTDEARKLGSADEPTNFANSTIKPCCQQRKAGNASGDTTPVNTLPSSSSTLPSTPQSKQHTISSSAVNEPAEPADQLSSSVDDAPIRLAIPPVKRPKHDHGEQSPTFADLNSRVNTGSHAWHAGEHFPAVSVSDSFPAAPSFWHHPFQSDHPSIQRQYSLPQVGLNHHLQPSMVNSHNLNLSSITNRSLLHQCSCGETCQCLGCAEHPTNARTTDYVRDTVKYMFTDDFDEMSSPIKKIGTGQEFRMRRPSQIRVEKNRNGGNASRKMIASNLAAHAATMEDLSQPYWPMHAVNQNPVTMPAANTSGCSVPATDGQHNLYSNDKGNERNMTIAEDRFGMGVYPSPLPRTGTDGSSNNNNEDSTCLSPSAFHLQQFVIPGCSDMTGACLCGDGCTCYGCLTHNGHSGYGGEDGLGMGFPGMPTATRASAAPSSSYYYAGGDPMAMAHSRFAQDGSVGNATVPG